MTIIPQDIGGQAGAGGGSQTTGAGGSQTTGSGVGHTGSGAGTSQPPST
ncbi:MAG: hypothetical protein P8179_03055 [Candidatus Thiodiazotropha sp.]